MSAKDPQKQIDVASQDDVSIVLSTDSKAPTKADVQRMFKVCKDKAGKEIEWLWTEDHRNFRLVTQFPLRDRSTSWDYERRDDPTWTLSDDREQGNPIIWHYKTSDLDLVFEVTRMIDRKPMRSSQSWAHSVDRSIDGREDREGRDSDRNDVGGKDSDKTHAGGAYSEANVRSDSEDSEDDGTETSDYSLEDSVIHDDLATNLYHDETGILSYSSFLLFLQREYEWHKAYGSPLSLIIFEIKTQVEGDSLTQWLPPERARLLDRRVIRRLTDIFGHFESFDFALALPNTDSRQATQIAQRISQILTRLPLDRNKPLTLKVTCGVANLPANGEALASLVMGAKGAKNRALETEQGMAVARSHQPYQVPPVAERGKGGNNAGLGAGISLRELLVRTGIVSDSVIDKAQILAKRMPLGRVLAMEGHVSEAIVETASELERMVNSKELTSAEALKALKIIADNNIALDAALKQIGVLKGGLKPNVFGDLLFDANLVSKANLDRAKRQSAFAGLTLGTVLTNSNHLSDTMLRAALACLRLVRQKVITREDAVRALDEMKVSGIPLGQALSGVPETALEPEPIARMLLAGGEVTESELVTAREMQLLSNCEISEALVSCGFIAPALVESAKKLL